MPVHECQVILKFYQFHSSMHVVLVCVDETHEQFVTHYEIDVGLCRREEPLEK